MSSVNSLIGSTGDHLAIGTSQTKRLVGSEMNFAMNYSSPVHAMAAPDVAVKLLRDRPVLRSHSTTKRPALV